MKKEYGGLGVPNLKDFNLCLLGLVWKPTNPRVIRHIPQVGTLRDSDHQAGHLDLWKPTYQGKLGPFSVGIEGEQTHASRGWDKKTCRVWRPCAAARPCAAPGSIAPKWPLVILFLLGHLPNEGVWLGNATARCSVPWWPAPAIKGGLMVMGEEVH
jgi:hypothetical protein